MKLTVGSRWSSAVSGAEVIVISAPDAEVDLRCGDVPMVTARDAGAADTAATGEVVLGKRYGTESGDIKLLGVKGGAGTLSVDGVQLAIMDTKSLPSSD